MTQRIAEPVMVGMSSAPKWVSWRGRVYGIKKIGLHHTFWEGNTLFHVFSVTSETLFLRLKFNTLTLKWVLEEVSDAF